MTCCKGNVFTLTLLVVAVVVAVVVVAVAVGMTTVGRWSPASRSGPGTASIKLKPNGQGFDGCPAWLELSNISLSWQTNRKALSMLYLFVSYLLLHIYYFSPDRGSHWLHWFFSWYRVFINIVYDTRHHSSEFFTTLSNMSSTLLYSKTYLLIRHNTAYTFCMSMLKTENRR